MIEISDEEELNRETIAKIYKFLNDTRLETDQLSDLTSLTVEKFQIEFIDFIEQTRHRIKLLTNPEQESTDPFAIRVKENMAKPYDPKFQVVGYSNDPRQPKHLQGLPIIDQMLGIAFKED